MQCSGGFDYDGKCPRPDVCVPMNDDCPAFCPVNCGRHEMFCPGGIDSKGCPKEDSCRGTDPYAKGQEFCPANCNENELWCHGGFDPQGYEMPDFCIQNDYESECPSFCPTNCDPNFEVHCPGGVDARMSYA